MFWESSPNDQTLSALKSLPLKHVVINTLEHPPEGSERLGSLNPIEFYTQQLNALASDLEVTLESKNTPD